MIASIRGEVLSHGAGWVVIGVGGLGVRVETPTTTPGVSAGGFLELHTQLVVREDSLTLFGFAAPEELQVFNLLLSVSGVGPRSALGVLSELTPAQIARAAESEDEKPFRKVSGIGPKTAKLIAVQLAGKLQGLALSLRDAAESTHGGTAEGQNEVNSVAATVTQALIGLGYREFDAERAVADARAAGAPDDHAGLLRASLALLQTPRPGARSSAKVVSGP